MPGSRRPRCEHVTGQFKGLTVQGRAGGVSVASPVCNEISKVWQSGGKAGLIENSKHLLAGPQHQSRSTIGPIERGTLVFCRLVDYTGP